MIDLVDYITMIVCTILFLVLGVILGKEAEKNTWQRESVERGVAKYDEKTGKWLWTVDKLPELEEGVKITGDPK